jgi:negative regulator of flagellin synthesis FlgM
MDNWVYDRSSHEPRIRWELVERIRREIAAGSYETSEKLDMALDRLLERLEEE